MKIPTKKECLKLLHKNKTPSNVIGHSKAVCKVAGNIAKKLAGKGVKSNKNLVIAAALLHDIERLKENDQNVTTKLKAIENLILK